ncbi:hypothetical protein ACE6H2_017210 [Prunus campanulata]
MASKRILKELKDLQKLVEIKVWVMVLLGTDLEGADGVAQIFGVSDLSMGLEMDFDQNRTVGLSPNTVLPSLLLRKTELKKQSKPSFIFNFIFASITLQVLCF